MQVGEIKISGLSKRYRLGEGRPAYRTLREAVTESVSALVKIGERGRQKTEEEHWALRDVSIDVPPGQVLGVIGSPLAAAKKKKAVVKDQIGLFEQS